METKSKKSNTIVIFASIFILAGLLCNEWTLASLFSQDGSIALSKKIVIRFFDLAIITIGLVLIVNRRSLGARQFLYFFYALAIIFLITEVGLHAVNYAVNVGKDNELKDKRYLMSPYEGEKWAKDMFREKEELVGEYKEFRGWGKQEYKGKYINIDSMGARRTWNPESIDSDAYKNLYAFGPSVIWGLGARDDYTMPSAISKELNSRGYRFKVTNYGEWAYSFKQEIFYLINLLRDGHRPEYVMFYAWSDIFNAYQSGRPGTLHFDFTRRFKEQELSDAQLLWKGFTGILSRNSMIYKQAMKIGRKLDPPTSRFTEVGHTFNEAQLNTLLKDTMKDFSKSYDLLDKLSKTYGFQYVCIWPPVLFTEKHVTEEEAAYSTYLHDNVLKKLLRDANELHKTSSFPHFYNISDAFDGKSKTFFIDFAHISEEANKIIAKKVVSIFEKEFLLHE